MGGWPAIARGLAESGRSREEFTLSATVLCILDEDAGDASREAVRRQFAFYASTPAYRPVLELHGWGSYTGLHPLGSLSDHAYVCDDAGITVLIVHPKFAETGAQLAARCAGIKHLLTLGPADAGEDLLALCEQIPARGLVRGPAGEEDTAWLQCTGGILDTFCVAARTWDDAIDPPPPGPPRRFEDS